MPSNIHTFKKVPFQDDTGTERSATIRVNFKVKPYEFPKFKFYDRTWQLKVIKADYFMFDDSDYEVTLIDENGNVAEVFFVEEHEGVVEQVFHLALIEALDWISNTVETDTNA